MWDKILELMVNTIKGKNGKKLIAIIILVLILIVIIFPYINANFLYYDRIEKRINNLKSLVELSGKNLSESPNLLSEYNSIIEEINNAQSKSLNTIIEPESNNSFDYWIKFISGGFLFAIISLLGLFQKEKNKKLTFNTFIKKNFLIFILCIFIAVLLAFIFARIPTLISPWINAFAAPILQLLMIYLLFYKTKDKP